jgi:hypothetical protein
LVLKNKIDDDPHDPHNKFEDWPEDNGEKSPDDFPASSVSINFTQHDDPRPIIT